MTAFNPPGRRRAACGAPAAAHRCAAAAGDRPAHRGRGRGGAARAGPADRRRTTRRLQDRRDRPADAGISRPERPGRRLHGNRRPAPQRRHPAVRRLLRPGVECELAVRLAHDLPPGPCTPSRPPSGRRSSPPSRSSKTATAIWPELGIADADRRSVVPCRRRAGEPGPPDWRALDVGALPGRISVVTAIARRGRGADLLGHPMNCLAWLAGSSVAAAFGGLKAGQVIMLGSVTPPIWLTSPATVTVDFPPLPAVEVTLG